MDPSAPIEKTKSSFSVRFNYRLVIGFLLVIIAVMVWLWKPWEPQIDAKSRTIDVTGQAKVTAAPDEFIFSPTYEFKNANREAALAEVSAKSDVVVKKLKELGVSDSKIKTNTDGYDYPTLDKQDTTPTYSLRLTVTVNNKETAQKVQDYLVSTAPTGAVSPQLAFSDSKRKELEDKARDEATKEARKKAEQSAKNLGFSLGEVKSVNDGTNFGGTYPILRGGASAQDMAESSKLSLQPGENDLTYQVSVVYYVK